ncbi:hypothetical protein Aple_005620 [Acrocarpospora pleiomorpha]|uniref:Uncharacterized protein n=1 Tax=Acrocarpospora pleiomorpha TaxID=90975 RepID=A0A5M3X7L7_9ACTN|nr:hypothetical protein Aple_005620 [Acrocarpospora pleiomorpha]
MEEHCLRFTGHDAQDEIRMAGLDDHPFLPLSLFWPELAVEFPHSVIRAFAAVAVTGARTGGVNGPEIP